MLNIVIPMAGRGSRFQKAGFTLPKPLIPIHNQPMISLVINNLRPQYKHRFIFLCLEEHIQKYEIDKKLREWVKDCEIVLVNEVTEGAACTVLLAKQLINNQEPLMIANSDQWIDCDINHYLNFFELSGNDGAIMTMTADDPKWSFVRFNDHAIPCEVVEKQVVSNQGTVGIYNYRYGSDFVEAAESMIANNFRVNGEFYVAPTYNQMLAKGKTIVCYNIGSEGNGMYGLGIPLDLAKFENSVISRKAISDLIFEPIKTKSIQSLFK